MTRTSQRLRLPRITIIIYNPAGLCPKPFFGASSFIRSMDFCRGR